MYCAHIYYTRSSKEALLRMVCDAEKPKLTLTLPVPFLFLFILHDILYCSITKQTHENLQFTLKTKLIPNKFKQMFGICYCCCCFRYSSTHAKIILHKTNDYILSLSIMKSWGQLLDNENSYSALCEM